MRRLGFCRSSAPIPQSILFAWAVARVDSHGTGDMAPCQQYIRRFQPKCRCHCGDSEEIAVSIGILFGKLSDKPRRGHYISWPPRLKERVVWRTIVQGGLVVQCSTSIYLYQRRVGMGANNAYDGRILQLAIGGLSVAILAILSSS